jgi:capsular polysaccharide biosynthesis protein
MLSRLKEFVRKCVLAILRPITAYRNYTGIPRGEVYLSELKHVKLLASKKYPAIKRSRPLSVDEKIYWKFEQLLEDTPQETFVIEANNWRVWGNQGAVITDKGYLLKDVSREFEKPEHSIFKQLKLVAPEYLSGTTGIVTASGADMYYHWMFDILPRINMLNNCKPAGPVDQYVIDYRELPFQKESLSALNISDSQISRAIDHFGYHVEAERLLVPSLSSKLDVVSTETCQFLSKTFLKDIEPTAGPAWIYLKRTGKRKLLNEAEIEDYLFSLGFETVSCDNISVSMQAGIFNNADIVIGPHGAAFTNIVFCKPGTKIIEFFSPKWINPCYWTVCCEMGLAYYYQIGEGAPPDEHSDAKGTNADSDLSLEKLKKLFGQFHLLN